MRAFSSALKWSITFVSILWGIELVNGYFGHQFAVFGVVPRSQEGLRGVLLMPLLHGSFAHLAANTGPLLVFGTLLLMRGPGLFITQTLSITVLGGLGVWCIGRPNSVHIGASGLIFGYFGLLVMRGWYDRRFSSVIIAAAVGFLYGGMIWGVLPRQAYVSWEGHLSGLLAGIVTARLFVARRKR